MPFMFALAVFGGAAASGGILYATSRPEHWYSLPLGVLVLGLMAAYIWFKEQIGGRR